MPPKLVIRRVIKAKRERVFDAWTNPEIMCKWFFCKEGKAIVKNDFKVGGTYENEMIHTNGCATSLDSSSHLHYGEYVEISPPEKIVFTWNSALVKNSRVTVELQNMGESTELTLTHELLETENLRDQHRMGWEGCLINLLNYMTVHD